MLLQKSKELKKFLTETFAVKTIGTLAALDTLANEEQSDEEEESAPEDTGQDE